MTDPTTDPQRKSWLAAANAPDCPFPIQNLPYGVFRLGSRGFRGRVRRRRIDPMQLTHFGHSCLLADFGATTVLFDPGNFSHGFEGITGLAARCGLAAWLALC